MFKKFIITFVFLFGFTYSNWILVSTESIEIKNIPSFKLLTIKNTQTKHLYTIAMIGEKFISINYVGLDFKEEIEYIQTNVSTYFNKASAIWTILTNTEVSNK